MRKTPQAGPCAAKDFNLIFRVLEMGIDLARSAAELDKFGIANRPVIDRLGENQPDLWDRLKARARERRRRWAKDARPGAARC